MDVKREEQRPILLAAAVLLGVILLLGVMPAMTATAGPVRPQEPAAGVAERGAVPQAPAAPAAVLCWGTIDGTTVYSSTDASGLQSAADVAAPGDTIKVAGTCAGVQMRAGITQTLYIDTSGITIQGGYTYTNWMADPDPDTYPTTLDAEERGRVVFLNTDSVTLSGLNLINGNVHGSGNGGAIHGGTNVTLTHLSILSNTANYGGGIHYGGNSTLLISDTILRANHATANAPNGGAIYQYNGTLSITNTIIDDNQGNWAGGLRAINATVTSSTISNNYASHWGGGIYNVGTLTLIDTTVENNRANNGFGGGILNDDTLEITTCTLQYNEGQAIYSRNGGLLTIDSSQIYSNTAYDGAGLFLEGSTTSIRDTHIFGNEAQDDGAGLYVDGGMLTLDRSQVYDNHTLGTSNGNLGGAFHATSSATVDIGYSSIYENFAGAGGAWFSHGGLISVTHSAIHRNTATYHPGILQEAGSTLLLSNTTLSENGTTVGGDGALRSWNSDSNRVLLVHTTIADNAGAGLELFSGGLVITNTLLSNNGGGNCLHSGGVITSGNYNLSSDTSCDLTHTHDITGTDALIGTLADNGGETLTHLPLELSPAIDGIPTSHCSLTTDQRGTSRPIDGACDIGAVELAQEYPMIAYDDVYTTSAYIPLSVDAPGVLANDSDGDHDPFTAVLIASPVNGDVTLATDGSFVYTPPSGFTGADTFVYRADDGSTTSLVGYWSFDEGSGTRAFDLSGNGYHGTLTYGPVYTTTVPPTPTFDNPYALALDGVDDGVYVSAGSKINLGSHPLRTVSAWFNVEDKTITTTKQVIWEEGGYINGLGIYVHDGTLYGGAWSGSDLSWVSTTLVTSDEWHHVALVLDAGVSPGTLTLYLDGQPTATVEGYVLAQHNNSNGIGRVGDDTKFHDGNFDGSPSIADHTFGGLIDDVRVYNAALSEAEVQALMLDDVPLNLARVTVNVTPLPTAALEGTVTDSTTGQPLEGASVEAVYNPVATFNATTDADGFYGWIVPTFTYTVTAWMNYGYYPATITDVVVTAPTTTLDIALDPMPTYVVSGTVTDAAAGWPLYAQIDIDGYPGDPVWTDPLSGFYSVTLASERTYTFNVATWVEGYTGATRSVGPLTGDASESFALLAETTFCTAPGHEVDATGLYEDFDSGVFPPTGWTVVNNGGDCEWRGDDPGGYGNLTGGDGAFAIADSNSCGSGTTMNTDLFSPIVDVSSLTTVTLQFAYDFRRFIRDQASVYVSDDGGTSWQHVLTWNNSRRGPGLFSQDVTALVGGSTQAQVRFRYTSGWDWWWQVDNVSLGEVDCNPRAGGLVVGQVYDENTAGTLAGATVENELGHTFTSGTTDDPAVEDGFYVAFAPAGSATLTATQEGGYGPDTDTVTVPLSDTVNHDFHLPAGRLEATHDVLSVTLDLGATTTLPLTLSNTGTLTAEFELVELNRGFDPAELEQGTIEWLYRSTAGVQTQVSEGNGGATLRTPGAYRYTPAYTTGDYNILVYTDDWVHAPPDTLVQQALTYLGLPATVYVEDYTGFQNSLNNGGPWDLVVWSGEYWGADLSLLDDLQAYLQGGGRLAATYWGVAYNPDHGLWAEMGFSYVSEYMTAPPIYWWDADHPLFTVPMDAPEWLDRIDDNPFVVQGIRMEPLNDGTALAGYTTGPAADETALILRDDGMALFKGFLDVSTDADANGNGILDGTELWINIIYGMVEGFEGVPWLSENPIGGTLPAPGSQAIDVTFDAGAVWQPGTYYATLNVGDDTPYGVPAIPVTMTVNTPSGWGKVEGTLSGLGTCNVDPAPLIGRDIRIEDSTGAVYTTTTGGTGSYEWWSDPGTGPLTITAAIEGYEEQSVTGVVVTAGEVTTVDLELRLLEPCVSVWPTSLEYAVALGDSVTGTLDLLNSGALSSTFELTETLSWLSASPVSGTLDADGVQAVDLLFDSSVLTQTGLYGGELLVLSDDPSTPSIPVPVDLWVVSGTAGVALGPDSLLAAVPGAVVTHTFVLTNTGDVTDTYGLALSGHTWPTSAPASTGFLAPGETFTVPVVVTIPLNPRDVAALIGSDTFTLTASSQVDGTAAAASGTTEAVADLGVALGPDSLLAAAPGEVVTHTFTLTNTGEAIDAYDLALSGHTWPAALLDTETGYLAPGETFTVSVVVTIPASPQGVAAIVGSDTFTLTASSQVDGTAAAANGTTEATAAVGVALGDDRSGSGSAGEVVSYTLQVTNTGEFTDTFDLTASGNTWPVALSATSMTLGAGEAGSVVVSVTIPGGAGGGSSDAVTITATSRLDSLVSDSAVLMTQVEGYEIYLPLVLKGTG